VQRWFMMTGLLNTFIYLVALPMLSGIYGLHTQLVYLFIILVGYGDYFPKTILGRIVGLCAAMIGTMVTSLFIVNLQSRLSLRGIEQQVYNVYQRLFIL
jgi:hypothetical protein